MKKLLFTLGSIATIVTPVVVTSCGSKKHNNHSEETIYVPTLSPDLAAKTQKDHLAMWDNYEWVTPPDHWFDSSYSPKPQPYVVQTKVDAKRDVAISSIKAFLDDITKIHEKISDANLSVKAASAWDKIQYVINQVNADYIDKHTENAVVIINVSYQLILPLITTISDQASARDFLITVLKDHTSNGNTVTDEDSFKAYKAKADETIGAKLAIFETYLNI